MIEMRNPPKPKPLKTISSLGMCEVTCNFSSFCTSGDDTSENEPRTEVYDLFSFPQLMAFHHLPPCLHNLHRKNIFLKIKHPLYCILCSLRTFVIESAPSQTCYTHMVGWTLPHRLVICWILLNSNVRHPAVGGMGLSWLMSHGSDFIYKLFMRLFSCHCNTL